MKKQELIEKINAIPWDEGLVVDTLKINRAGLLQLIEQLDEPQKVQVPEFVADWIFKAQLVDRRSIRSALDTCTIRLYAKNSDEVIDWLKKISNQDTFASAWANDYEVEKEKRYEVILCNGQSLKTVYRQGGDRLDFEKVYGDLERFTRKQLEDAGFGWVFNCEGIVVREAE